ncbi:MAG: ribonuclease HII [Firmicutes bacterium]|nr:ribonuclease HII [Bacillota bacterium]
MSNGARQLYDFRRQIEERGFDKIAGVDEAGRGPLAGPIVAGAVVLPRQQLPFLVCDSKQIAEKKRAKLYEHIFKVAVSVGIGIVSPGRIDEINIHNATLEAMHKAVTHLKLKADFYIVDGKFRIPNLKIPGKAVVLGDAQVDCVAAASIIAKVTRDKLLLELDEQYPQYGFASHKGYPTPKHLAALKTYGPCPVHRFSFAPVRLAHQSLFQWAEDNTAKQDTS